MVNGRWLLAVAVTLLGCGPAVAVDSATEDSTGPVEGTSSTGGQTVTMTPEVADSTSTSGGPVVACVAGETRCLDDETLEVCADDGSAWMAEPCPSAAICVEDRCAGPCEFAEGTLGCDFVVSRLLGIDEELLDNVVVANGDVRNTANVQLFRTTVGGGEEELVEEIALGPGETVRWTMDTNTGPVSSWFRVGGMYRVRSDLPVAAHHHMPGSVATSADSSLLMPYRLLGREYVVLSYSPHAYQQLNLGPPSYFDVVVLSDNTTLEWTPPVPTEPVNLAIGPVLAGGTGVVPGLHAYDGLRIIAANAFPDIAVADRDLSGTVITATQPILVTTGTRCARVPAREQPLGGFCDGIQEVVIPLAHWGSESFAAPSPPRDNEGHYWRIYAGAQGTTTFTTSPNVMTAENCPSPASYADGACTLPQRGAWVEVAVPNGVGFTVAGVTEEDRLMVVGYLQSRHHPGEPENASAGEIGDPAMYQVVSTETFDTHYVLAGGVGYEFEYIQIVRAAGAATVFINGDSVASWQQFGDYEVANETFPLSSVVVLDSQDAFGVTQFGYSDAGHVNPDCTQRSGLCSSSYAHPGGWTTSGSTR